MFTNHSNSLIYQWAGDLKRGDSVPEGSQGQTTGSYQGVRGWPEEDQRWPGEEVTAGNGGRKWGYC